MANAVYPKAKESFLGQNPSIDLDTDAIKLAIVDATAAYSAGDQFWSALSAKVVGTPQALATKAVTGGKFTSDPASFTGVTVTGGKLVLYKDTGSAATSPLIAFLDTGTNVPITVAGGNVTVSPDGTNGWFSL